MGWRSGPFILIIFVVCPVVLLPVARYLENIRYVDAGIEALEARLDAFYGGDGRTAWVFTSDHGMGNRGAHGDGHPDNTMTPLVAYVLCLV